MVQVRTGRIYEFDGFQVDVDARRLLRNGEPVPLYGKAFEMLLVLVRNRGRLLTKDELFELVWPDQIVEESNLTVNMSAIRRALGERANSPRYITTVSGRGYRFTGDVRETAGAHDELTVESETFTRVVVEQEEDTDTPLVGAVNIIPVALSRGSDETPTALGDTSATALAPALAARSEAASRRRAFAIATLLLLLLGVGAIWLYQSRSQRKQTVASTPPPQITARRFTTHSGVPFRATISPDGKMLVYTQHADGKDLLWLGQIETNTSVPLVPEELGFDNLVFTPDGNSVYFTVSGKKGREEMLVRMAVLGGVITELIPGVHGPVTFAPDGKQMAFLRRDGPTWQTASMIIADADGQNQHSLTSRKTPEQFSNDGLSWSPDGKTIAFSVYTENGQEEILSVDVKDGSLTRIGRRDWGRLERVVWLPDGSGLLALASKNFGERLLRIWSVSYPGGEAHPISDDLNVFLRESSLSVSADRKLVVLQGHINSDIWIAPQGDATRARRVLQGVPPRFEGVDGLAWTPDGRLLYTAYVGNSQVIWSMNADGSDLRQLTSNKAYTSDTRMSVTADGRYVVFQSNRSGTVEIWRMSSDGSDLKQLTTGGNNREPVLSPDGRWVIYSATRDARTTLWRISIDGGEPMQITDTSCSWPHVSADGQYISCMASSPPRLIVIPFWGGHPIKSFDVPVTRRGRWTPDGKAILYPRWGPGLWRQALNEEKPIQIKGFEELTLYRLEWSFDGKHLAYTSGPLTQEIIIIENFK